MYYLYASIIYNPLVPVPIIHIFLFYIFKAPKTVRLHAGKLARSPGGLPQQSQSSQWDSIIKFLDSLMDRLRENHVRAILFFLSSFIEFNYYIRIYAFSLWSFKFYVFCTGAHSPPPEHVSINGQYQYA